MSKNELTSGEKDTIIRSKEPTVITTASGKAGSTEQTTVYSNDLDVFCHNDDVGRFTSSAFFGFILRRNELLLRMDKEGVSILN